ncbi:MAG: MFS transporter [Thermosynechococcaceae cyanobacterium MS004]|nr:MFS transporter [Thermosynechococcaceae cyanobacterium MS004]
MQPSGPSPSSGFRALINNRGFVNLWIGQIISQLADKIFFVLLIALVVDYQTPRMLENFSRASVMIANTLPAVFFGTAAGIFVDRWSKRQIMTFSNAGRGILVLMIPVLPKDLGFLLLIAFLESILTQFFAPAEQAAIPALVERQNLMPANALFTATMLGSLVIGFAVGEPLLTWAKTWGGRAGGVLLVGGLYLLASFLLSLLPADDPQVEGEVKLHPLSDLKQGLKYLKKSRLLSSAMIQLTILYCVFAALSVLAIGLAAEIGLKPTQFGFLLAAAGVGLILGAAILGQWGDRLHHQPLPLFGFISMGLVLMVFSFVNYLWLGLLLSFLLGVGAAFVGVPMQTLIQVQTPPEMRGKVFGVQNNVINIALSLPLAIAGLLADAIGLQQVLIGMGATVIIAGLWAWRRTQQVLQDAI